MSSANCLLMRMSNRAAFCSQCAPRKGGIGGLGEGGVWAEEEEGRQVSQGMGTVGSQVGCGAPGHRSLASLELMVSGQHYRSVVGEAWE